MYNSNNNERLQEQRSQLDTTRMLTDQVRDYNSNPQRYTDAQAESIAKVAQALDLNFERESQPFKKAAFEAADMAIFGLLPDSIFKPDISRGEETFGPTTTDRIASGLGMGLGFVGGVGGVYKGGKSLLGIVGKLSPRQVAQNFIRKARQQASIAGGIASAAGRGAAGLGMGMGRAGANYARMGRSKAASALSKNLNIPMDAAEKYLNYSAVGAGSLLGLNALLGSEALPVLEEGTPKNPFSSYYNYPKLYGNAPAEERYFSDPNR